MSGSPTNNPVRFVLDSTTRNDGKEYKNMKQFFIRYGGEPPKVETESDMIMLSDGSTRPNTPEARAAYQAERRRFLEAQQRQMDKLNAQHTGRGCPIQYEIDQGHPRECRTSCVFYRGGGCVFAGQAATVDTKGGSCPFMYGKPCYDGCAWYDGGCTMTIAKEYEA